MQFQRFSLHFFFFFFLSFFILYFNNCHYMVSHHQVSYNIAFLNSYTRSWLCVVLLCRITCRYFERILICSSVLFSVSFSFFYFWFRFPVYATSLCVIQYKVEFAWLISIYQSITKRIRFTCYSNECGIQTFKRPTESKTKWVKRWTRRNTEKEAQQ